MASDSCCEREEKGEKERLTNLVLFKADHLRVEGQTAKNIQAAYIGCDGFKKKKKEGTKLGE